MPTFANNLIVSTEAMDFFYWVRQNIKYRYDDEQDPEGSLEFAAGLITKEQLGDRRDGGEYWQKPMETLIEGFGDCDDHAILHLAFYWHWGIEAYLAIVDVDGDGVIDHAICIVLFDEEAFNELVEYMGLVHFYEFHNQKYVIVDSTYSEEFGFIGRFCLITGEPLPPEIMDFGLYEVLMLEEVYLRRWRC